MTQLPAFQASATVQIQIPTLLSTQTALVDALYLPFLGKTAVSLYHLLAQEGQLKASAQENHHFLLDSLNVNLSDFVIARQKLEAVGLLKTTFDAQTYQQIYTYYVQLPLTPRAFFAEPLLSGLLYRFVGEMRFEQLQQRFSTDQQLVGDDISATFTQVYAIPEHAPVLSASQPEPLIAAPTIDWEAVASLLTNQGITTKMLAEHAPFLHAQVLLYGLDETQLAMVIQQTLTLDQRTIDEQAIRQVLAQKSTVEQVSERPQTVADKAPKTPADNPLVAAAQQLTPMAFLQQLQQQRGGFVTHGERRVVSQLVEKQILVPEVVNILIHEILIGQEKPTVSQGLAEAIANSWHQQGIQTAQAAVAFIAKRQQTTSKSATTSRQRTAKKVEEKPVYQKPENVDDDTLAKAFEQLDQLD
jgi:replication initiation and membrane attachment protein